MALALTLHEEPRAVPAGYEYAAPPNTKVTNPIEFVTLMLAVRRTAHCGRRGT